MKPVFVILIALGTGTAGFVAGGGLGLLGGASAGGQIGSVAGMCLVADTATKQGTMTPDQAEKIGIDIGTTLKAQSKGKSSANLSVEGTTESCKRLVQGISQAGK